MENTEKIYKVAGNPNLTITVPGYIVKEGEKIIGRGYGNKVKVSLYNSEEREVNISWLFYLSVNGGYIHRNYTDIIYDYSFVPVYTSYGKIMDDKQPIFKNPRYFPGTNLRFIPGYGHMVVSDKGEFYVINNRCELIEKTVYVVTNYDYPRIQVDGKIIRPAHRLVALAWCEPPEDGKYILVDHIDGNKKNYHSSNLRWVTPKENSNVTKIQGVKHDNFYVMVRNIDTGYEETYTSLTSVCGAIKRSKINTVITPIGPGKVFETETGRYEIKYASDPTPWVYVNGRLPESNSILRDTLKAFNGKMPKMMRVSGPNFGTRTFTSIQSLFHDFLKCEITIENIKNVESILQNRYPGFTLTYLDERSYEARNYHNGEIVNGKSLADIAVKTGISKSSAIKYCGLGKIFNGWLIRPIDPDNEKPWPNITESMPDNAPMCFDLVRIDPNTKEEIGEAQRFQSLRSLCETMKWDRKTIRATITANDGTFTTGRYGPFLIKPIGRSRLELSENNPRASNSKYFTPINQ